MPTLPRSASRWLLGYAESLRFPQLLFLVGGIFFVDLIVPDVIPLVDELLLGLLTLLFGLWRRRGGEASGEPAKPPEKDVTPPHGAP